METNRSYRRPDPRSADAVQEALKNAVLVVVPEPPPSAGHGFRISVLAASFAIGFFAVWTLAPTLFAPHGKSDPATVSVGARGTAKTPRRLSPPARSRRIRAALPERNRPADPA